MQVRCGIDLGTTYSSISWFDPYNNRVDTIDLESADGAKVLRSVVYYPGSNQPVVVGEAAIARAYELAKTATTIRASITGTAGLAGLLSAPRPSAAVIFSGSDL